MSLVFWWGGWGVSIQIVDPEVKTLFTGRRGVVTGRIIAVAYGRAIRFATQSDPCACRHPEGGTGMGRAGGNRFHLNDDLIPQQAGRYLKSLARRRSGWL
jgi:hypothetical protein